MLAIARVLVTARLQAIAERVELVKPAESSTGEVPM